MSKTPNPKVIEEWVEALESGEYPQGSGYLSRHGKYCCLGVLCELAVKAGIVTTVESSAVSEGAKRYDGNTSTLPSSVMEWAGLSEPNPQLRYVEDWEGKPMERRSDCVYENDAQRRTFEEVAAMVRGTYLGSPDAVV